MKSIIRLSSVPPTTNHLYRTTQGRRYKTADLVTWQRAAGWDLQSQRPKKWAQPVYLTIAIGKLRKGSDCSNRIKAVEDLLVTHGIIPGDDIAWVRGVNCYIAQIPFEGVEIAISPAAEAVAA